jgi:hypothetical protein
MRNNTQGKQPFLLTQRAVASLCLFVTLMALASCRGNAPMRLETEQTPRALVPGATASSSPRLGLWLPNTVLALAVAGEGTESRVQFSRSETGGDSFRDAVMLSEPKAHIRSQGENSPVLYTNVQGDIYAGWFQSDSVGDAQYIVARSGTFGESFEKPVNVLDPDRKPEGYAGFPTMTASHKGEVYVAWLDEREPPQPEGTSAVYFSRSTDHGATFSRNIRIAGAACPCCRPQLALGPNGEIYLAWRKVFKGDIRDIVMARSLDGGKTFSEPVRVAEDNWLLHACPDTGPTLVSSGTRVYVAWYSEGQGNPGVRLAVSEDHGQSFLPAKRASGDVLDANHPRLSISEDGRILLALQGRSSSDKEPWKSNQLYLVSVADDGAISTPAQITTGNHSATHPDLVAGTSGRVFVAWNETGDQTTQARFSRAWIK